jgi:hypothetical protein
MDRSEINDLFLRVIRKIFRLDLYKWYKFNLMKYFLEHPSRAY